MRESLQLRKWSLAIVALALAFIVALLAGARNDGEFGDERNDTFGYVQHFDCLAKGTAIPECNTIISTNATEYLYPALVAAIAAASGPDHRYLFKFVMALGISFAILFSSGLVSKVPSLTFIILLLDFRFWEYVANSLRNGVAVALFISLFAFYKLRGKHFPLFAKLAAGLAHSGALVLALAPQKKLGMKTIALLGAACALVVGGARFWLPLLADGNLFGAKLAFYVFLVQDEATGFALPVHYIAIFFALAYMYRKSADQTYIEICNVLLLLLMFAAVLDILNLGYRAISLMLPFVAIGVTYPLAMLAPATAPPGPADLATHASPLVRSLGFMVMYFLIVASFGLAFLRNFEFVQLHLF